MPSEPVRPGDVNSEFGGGRYRLVRELGRGGQGCVHLAIDTRLKRKVALKLLTNVAFASDSAKERFRREAMVASKLDDPGICTVFDSGEESGALFLVMQFVDGITLSNSIAESRRVAAESESTSVYMDFDEDSDAADITQAIDQESSSPGRDDISRCLHLFEQMARSLHVAHEAGVIHRDVKPANIMIAKDGRPVILDFGLAREDDRDLPALTQSGEIFGTPAYMSPEQVSKDAAELDRRTDIYSLGVSLYEALTLRWPFKAPTRHQLFEAIRWKRPTDPRALNRNLSDDLAVVIATAMEKDRDRRYQTAIDFAEELGRARRGEPVLARPVNPLIHFRRWFARNPAFASSVCAAFVFLVAGVVTAWVYASRVRVERDRADSEKAAYERLADARRYSDLRAEADELWPCVPEMVPPMEAWLARAHALAARLTEHHVQLEQLRARAVPSDDSDRNSGRRTQPEPVRHLQVVKDEIQALTEKLDARPGGEASTNGRGVDDSALIDRLDELREVEQDLEGSIIVPEERRFEENADQWRFEKLVELVRDLERLGGEVSTPGTIAEIESRLSLARSLRRLSVTDHREAWDLALDEIGRSEVYAGLQFKEQIGLVPLGFNPEGYYEFIHIQSGTIPTRDEDRDRYALSEVTGVILVLLPGGPFIMGAPREEAGRLPRESQHRVNLAPYLIGKHEITQSQWKRIMGRNPSNFRPPVHLEQTITSMHPVEQVSWTECRDFARRNGLSLPTEAQWEFACRAGTRTAYTWGENPGCLEGRSNVADQNLRGTRYGALTIEEWKDDWRYHHPIDEGAVNGFGLHGLHGNIAEWCHDRFGQTFPPEERLPGTGENIWAWKKERSYRDGNWLVPADYARTAKRHAAVPSTKIQTLGLRVARAMD